ncbi:hypothetical protein AVEN_30564-1 [Araneus ventricosus]|uniref:Uncharacterized protein n=1 Tax=Araneus ventricosus TaxID=182803 RepID=A0A4Y2H9X2_ARAVE|nr:hypothetical protein AVEN_30564-1 [Araneus ventricosus]
MNEERATFTNIRRWFKSELTELSRDQNSQCSNIPIPTRVNELITAFKRRGRWSYLCRKMLEISVPDVSVGYRIDCEEHIKRPKPKHWEHHHGSRTSDFPQHWSLKKKLPGRSPFQNRCEVQEAVVSFASRPGPDFFFGTDSSVLPTWNSSTQAMGDM